MSVVFADVDTGIDDALAVIYLLASPDADLVGIASTGGNIAVGQVCANNLSLLELCGAADIPVVDVDPTGATVTDWSGKRNPNARIGMSVDPAVFFDRFVERIGRFARRT